MTDSHDPARHDTPLDESELAELRARLIAEPPDDATRHRHLAAAMDAYDEVGATGTVVRLDGAARRRRGRTFTWAAAAAAVLLVVAVGAQLAVRDAGQQDSAGSAAIADSTSPREADDGTAIAGGADRDAAAEETVAATAEAPSAPYADEFGPGAAGIRLGAVPDDDALRDAALAASTGARERIDDGATTPPAASLDAAPRDAAPSSCGEHVDALPSPRLWATVAGRPVVAAFDGDGADASLVVVALDDCTVRRV